MNLYHHVLLRLSREIRNNNVDFEVTEKKYVRPEMIGGCFSCMTCPHYFFELVAWFGVVIVCRHVAALVLWCSMFAFLVPKWRETSRWYADPANQHKFVEFAGHDPLPEEDRLVDEAVVS